MADRDRPKHPGSNPEIPQQQTPDVSESAEPVPGVEGPTPITVTGIDIEAALRGVAFPVMAKDIVDRARQNGVEEHILDRLAELPERRFTSLGDALRQLDMLS